MDNHLVAIVVLAFLGVFLGVGLMALLCKACSLCTGSCHSCCRQRHMKDGLPYKKDAEMCIERITPAPTFIRYQRQITVIGDETDNNKNNVETKKLTDKTMDEQTNFLY